MSQPSDGVGLAAAGGVLDKIVGPRATSARVGHKFPHAIKLVIARKDHRLPLHFFAPELLLLNLEMNEPRQDVQKTVPLQNFFPQIGGLISTEILRLPAPPPNPLLKGRKWVLRPDRRVVI